MIPRPNSTYKLSLAACFIFLLLACYAGKEAGKWSLEKIINWDIAGYHLYLPASIIYKDISDYTFYKKIDERYKPSNDVQYYGLDVHPISGKRVNKYTCGVSYFELPFFLVAHAYATASNKYIADGFSAPYQFGVLLCSIIFAFLGLLVLRKFLIRLLFSDISIAACILILALGTNLYSYTAYQPGMGHPISFFLYACILYCTQALFTNYSRKHFIFLGIAFGLAILIRPVDIIALLIPLLWGGKKSLSFIKTIFQKHWTSLALGILAACLVWAPQFIYWKYTTGSFLFYSYGSEGFDFTNPQILNGLFSFRKGWFVYTPLAALGFIGLLIALRKKEFMAYHISILSFYLLSFYIIFSWHQWYYGGSFGARVMINSLPLLAIPICIFLREILKAKLWIKAIASVVILLFMYINMFQSWQYNRSIIHWDSMNQKYYWRVFLKKEMTEEDKQLL